MNISIIFSFICGFLAVLALGVVVLFLLQFYDDKKPRPRWSIVGAWVCITVALTLASSLLYTVSK
jgi:Na+-driven multidrug efflux pump